MTVTTPAGASFRRRAERDIGHDHRHWFLKGDGNAIWLCVGYVVLGQVGEADHRCHFGRERHSYSTVTTPVGTSEGN